MDFSQAAIESFKRKARRLKSGVAATIVAGAAAIPSMAQADIPAALMGNELAPGGIYTGHMVLGAADGLKALDELNEDTIERVEDLRENIVFVRKYMDKNDTDALLDVQRMGYDQAMNGGWDDISLNAYIDTIEMDDVQIYDNVAHADSAGLLLYPTPETARDANWHTLAASTLIYDVSTRYMDVYSSAEKPDVGPYGSGLIASVGNNVVADYEMLQEGIGPSFLKTTEYTLGTPTIMQKHAFPQVDQPTDARYDPFDISEEAAELLNDPFELSEEAEESLNDPFELSEEANALLDEALSDNGPGL